MLFKKKRKVEQEKDSFIDSREKYWIEREFEFSHQPEQLQIRINEVEHLTLGFLLNKFFDFNPEELSNLNLNINGKVTIINNQNEIWNLDIITPSLVFDDIGKFRIRSNNIISVNYISPDNEANISTIILHIIEVGGTNDKCVYFSITITRSVARFDRNRIGVLPQAFCKTILVAYDIKSTKELEVEFQNALLTLNQKIEQQQELAPYEWEMLDMETLITDKNLYWGHRKMQEKRYLEAILYLERVYKKLSNEYLLKGLTEEELNIFSHTAYMLGYCYIELEIFEKAFFYLDIAIGYSNSISYKNEYINCLCNSKDIRALAVINGYIGHFDEIKKERELTYNEFSFYLFLFRRKVYIFIDMQKYDIAEELAKELLKIDPENEIMKNELEYINRIKAQSN